jgi:RNA polymerase sigma-70 factor (ECF subfamily)
MTRVAAGDRAAFDTLVHRHRARVFGYVLRISATREAAEDALQETFVAAWRHAGDFRGPSLAAWLVGIAHRAVLRQGRRRVGEPSRLESFTELGERAGWGSDDPERVVARAEQRETLDAAITRLTPDAREALLLVAVDGMSYQDAAALTELALPAFKSRLHRARLELAAILRQEVEDGR